MMLNLFIVDWNEEDLFENIEPLLKEGWNIAYEFNEEVFAKVNIENLKPDVIVIYLDNSPSKGRYLAQLINKENSIKNIPLIFVNGRPKDITKAKKKYPNAIYCTSEHLKTVLLNLNQ